MFSLGSVLAITLPLSSCCSVRTMDCFVMDDMEVSSSLPVSLSLSRNEAS